MRALSSKGKLDVSRGKSPVVRNHQLKVQRERLKSGSRANNINGLQMER
jgi:hypothetical protein